MILLLVIAGCFLHMSALSQKARAGFSAGAVFANLRGDIGGVDQSGDIKPGFTGGFLVDVPLKGSISFQPGIYYVQKGKVQQEAIGTVQDKITYELRYVDLPLNFLYNTNYTGNNFYIGAGPYVSFNLPSKIVTHVSGGTKAESDLAFGNTNAEDYRGVDFGANFLTGYRLKGGFFVSFNYALGIRNLNPKGALVQGEVRNSSFGLSLGWLVNN